MVALRSETASEFWPYNQRQDPLKKSCVKMCGWRGRWLAGDCTQWCFESKVKMGRPPAAAATSTLDTSSTLSISDCQVFLLLTHTTSSFSPLSTSSSITINFHSLLQYIMVGWYKCISASNAWLIALITF